MLSKNIQVRVSKLMSLGLRHKPDALNLDLDSNGWANIDGLLLNLNSRSSLQNLSLKDIEYVVENCDKKRFEISQDKQKIRAVQGHSINTVDLELESKIPPNFLYHGTAKKFLSLILEQGLISKSRNHVHLSSDTQTAIDVGKRHGSPVVLTILSKQMFKDGIKFFQAKNGVWLVERVPTKYISLENLL